MRKILYYTDTNGIGGGERYLVDLIRESDRRGYDVTVLCNDRPDLLEYFRRTVSDACRVRVVSPFSLTRNRLVQSGLTVNRESRNRFSFLKVPGMFVYHAILLWTAFRLFFLFRSMRPDILHINAGGYPAAESLRSAALAGRWAGIPRRYMTVHGMADAPVGLPFLERVVDRAVEKALDLVIAVSRGSLESLIRVRGYRSSKLKLINNGIEESPVFLGRDEFCRHIGADPSLPIVGYIGRFLAIKGVDVLVSAFSDVNRAVPETQLILVGEGPLEESMRDKLRSLGIEKKVFFLGYQPQARKFMKAFDVLVVPSSGHDNFPYVVLEAMEAACPIVATNAGGTAEQIVNEESGLLIPPAAPDVMASAIVRLIRNRPEAERLGQKARLRMKELFRIERMLDSTIGLYEF
ncbi:MAG TPA: glycosyltransferase family 4 protein [Elusimicrobiota bacterium]|nr:glycosyltransferase family 4 protein [Elusimicrobiota bacterium]